MRLTLAILGAVLCLTHCGPAHGQDARDSLAAICPTRNAIAPLVEAAATSARVPAVVLVAQYREESSCGRNLVNLRTGTLGALQIMPGKSADPNRVGAAALMDDEVNFALGARHLRRCVDLCGGLAAGLHVYHGGRKCKDWRGDKYVRRVMALVSRARAMIARQQQARS